MLTVHHLRMSQSERIVWLCEELGLDYELKLYDRRSDNMLAPDEFKALHPAGMAPVITDGEITLAESGAIIDYITKTYGCGDLVPEPGTADFVDSLFWFHYGNATFMPGLMLRGLLAQAGAEAGSVFATQRVERAYAMIEKRLSEKDYFGGEKVTIADIMMLFPLTTLRMFGGGQPLAPELKATKAYLARIGERPAYRRAMEKCEPGMEPLLS